MIGDFVKINASVYICAEVTVEDFCMISAHAVFTNDRFPRAGNRSLTGLETSEPTDETLATRVGRGTTIGATRPSGPGSSWEVLDGGHGVGGDAQRTAVRAYGRQSR